MTRNQKGGNNWLQRTNTIQVTMGRVILTLLCLWSCIAIGTPLTSHQVLRATEYIKTTYNLNGKRQYAYVVVFTQTECESLSTKNNLNILQKEDATKIANALNNDERIYKGNQMVLATYRALQNEPNIHSEYRLLFPEEGQKISPVEDLLNENKNKAACAIFYTLNSPCVGVCTNTKHNQNIIGKLSVFQNFKNNKAFVYNKLYETDLKRKESIWSGLIDVNKQIDVYRCFSEKCYKCFEKSGNKFINKGHCIN